MAPGPLACLRRRHHVLGAGRDGPRPRADWSEGDDEATTRRKVRETLAEFVPDEDERRWIEAGLLALLGVGDRPPGGSDELFAAWRTFFERIAAQGRRSLVFEDLHWADAGLLDFIDHLLEWTRGVPIYIVTLARPELLERRPDWGAGKRTSAASRWSRWPSRRCARCSPGSAPGFPATAVRAIVARADGIPLYAVETVRMLVARGSAGRAATAPIAGRGPRRAGRPRDAHALIAARLDACPRRTGRCSRTPPCWARRSRWQGWRRSPGIGRTELEPRLRALVRREILARRRTRARRSAASTPSSRR